MSEPIQHLVRRDQLWQPTELAGTDVAEALYQAKSWARHRRLILIRHRKAVRPEAGGKMLLDVPGYVFQELVTSLPVNREPLEVWRHYNGRADCENVIKELQEGFAVSTAKKICGRERSWLDWPGLGIISLNMEPLATPHDCLPAKPICVGLTCWRWQSQKSKAIVELAQSLGVTVRLTQKLHGLHREIEAQVTGRNTDQFISEFVRHC